MSETPLLNAIRKAATSLGARLYRNNVGVARYPDGSRVVYGLYPGSSDLIGWTPVKIEQRHVGSTLAVFTSIEAKGPRGRLSVGQERWIAAVLAAGGIAAVARDVDDAERAIRSVGPHPE